MLLPIWISSNLSILFFVLALYVIYYLLPYIPDDNDITDTDNRHHKHHKHHYNKHDNRSLTKHKTNPHNKHNQYYGNDRHYNIPSSLNDYRYHQFNQNSSVKTHPPTPIKLPLSSSSPLSSSYNYTRYQKQPKTPFNDDLLNREYF